LAALEEGREVAKLIGDNAALGYLLANLGLTELYRGQPERAMQPLEESIALLEAAGNVYGAIKISGFLLYASMTVEKVVM
jgi:hypothetical protein